MDPSHYNNMYSYVNQGQGGPSGYRSKMISGRQPRNQAPYQREPASVKLESPSGYDLGLGLSPPSKYNQSRANSYMMLPVASEQPYHKQHEVYLDQYMDQQSPRRGVFVGQSTTLSDFYGFPTQSSDMYEKVSVKQESLDYAIQMQPSTSYISSSNEFDLFSQDFNQTMRYLDKAYSSPEVSEVLCCTQCGSGFKSATRLQQHYVNVHFGTQQAKEQKGGFLPFSEDPLAQDVLHNAKEMEQLQRINDIMVGKKRSPRG